MFRNVFKMYTEVNPNETVIVDFHIGRKGALMYYPCADSSISLREEKSCKLC